MTTLDIAVAASADDANELSSGNVQINTTAFNVDQTGEWQAARFIIPNPTAGLLAGATVTAAYITAQYDSGTLDEPDLTIYGEDTTTPAQYAAGTGTFSISSRTRTTASVNWGSTDLAAPGDFNSPSLVTIVQELVDTYDYSAGGVMAFMWTSRANDSTRDAQTVMYDGSTTLCWRLHIEYTAAGGTALVDIIGTGIIPTPR